LFAKKILVALAIAGATTLGVAGTASASSSGSDSATSSHGSWYQVYANNNVVGWHVNLGNTDEEFYFSAEDVCGNTYNFNWDDKYQSGYNNAWWTFPCTLSWAHLYPTDDGSQDGRIVTR
jgi:hypothetical protein